MVRPSSRNLIRVAFPIRRVHGRGGALALSPSSRIFAPLPPNLLLFELQRDRSTRMGWGSPFHPPPGSDAPLRPVVEFAFLYVDRSTARYCRQISPEDSVAATRVPILLIRAQIDSKAYLLPPRAASSPAIATQYSGKLPSPITAEPSAQLHRNSNDACSYGSPESHLSRSDSRLGRPAKQSEAELPSTAHCPFCISCAPPVHNPPPGSPKFFL